MQKTVVRSFLKQVSRHSLVFIAVVFIALSSWAPPSEAARMPNKCAYMLMNHLNDLQPHQLSALADLTTSLNARSNGEGEAMVLAVISGSNPRILNEFETIQVQATVLPQDKYIYQTLVSMHGPASEIKKGAELIARNAGDRELSFYTMLSRRPDFNLDAVNPEELSSVSMGGKGSQLSRIMGRAQEPEAKSQVVWIKGTTDIFFVFPTSDQPSQEAVRRALVVSNEIATESVDLNTPIAKWLAENLSRLTSENLVIQWGEALIVSQGALKVVHALKETSGQLDVAGTVPEDLGQLLTSYFHANPVEEIPTTQVEENAPKTGLADTEIRDRAIRLLRKHAPIGVAVGTEIARNYGLRRLIIEVFKKVTPSGQHRAIEQKIVDLGFSATAGATLSRAKNSMDAFTKSWEMLIERVTSKRFDDPFSEEAFTALEEGLAGKTAPKKNTEPAPVAATVDARGGKTASEAEAVTKPEEAKPASKGKTKAKKPKSDIQSEASPEKGGIKAAMISARDGKASSEAKVESKPEETPSEPESEPEPKPVPEIAAHPETQSQVTGEIRIQGGLDREKIRMIMNVLQKNTRLASFSEAGLARGFTDSSSRLWTKENKDDVIRQLNELKFVKSDIQLLSNAAPGKKALVRFEKAWRILSHLAGYAPGFEIDTAQIKDVDSKLQQARNFTPKAQIPTPQEQTPASQEVPQIQSGLDSVKVRMIFKVLQQNMPDGKLSESALVHVFTDVSAKLWTEKNKYSVLNELHTVGFVKSDYQMLMFREPGKRTLKRLEDAWRILSELAGSEPGFEITPKQIDSVNRKLKLVSGQGTQAVTAEEKVKTAKVRVASMKDWENAFWGLVGGDFNGNLNEEAEILRRIPKAVQTGVMYYEASHFELAKDWLAYDKKQQSGPAKIVDAVTQIAETIVRLQSSGSITPSASMPLASADEPLEFSRLLDSSYMPVPEAPYPLTFNNGKNYSVVFSSNVVKSLYANRGTRDVYAASFSRALTRGFIGMDELLGIRKLSGWGEKFVEIKVPGSIGQGRLVGCMDGTTIRLSRFVMKAGSKLGFGNYKEACK